MSFVETAESWLKQTFAVSNSWQTWRERLVALLFVAIGGGLFYLSMAWLAIWLSFILWTIYGLALAVCSRQGWIKLLGPVLFYDMVRTSRRSRYSIIRILYGGFLFLILCYMFLILTMSQRMGQELRPRDTAVLAETFFATFMFVQLTLVIVLTPSYVAGAIAEEKDRKTMEFLLATDLLSREIVLSKFVSRLLNLGLLLLTGLPVLSILQLIGGVDPELMLAGFAGVALTVLGIASVSILMSTLFKKPRDAISLTYLMLLAYVSLTSFALAASGHPALALPIWFGNDPPTIGSAILVLNAGNPISAIGDIISAINGRNGSNLATELPGILSRYAWFHLCLSAVCIIWSIVRVRAIALKQSTAGTTASLRWWDNYRPRIGTFPMVWKELFIEGRTKFNWLVWLAVLVLVLLTLGTGLWIVGAMIYERLDMPAEFRFDRIFQDLREPMNIWFRIAGTCVACLSLLMIGVRASTSITSERERETFDALIATPMSAEAILFGKLIGNLMSLRPAWLWIGSMILLAVCTTGLHPLAVPILISAWLVYALFVTMLGMAFSLFCNSSIWSALFTVLSTLVLGGGHWIITNCCCMPLFFMAMFGVAGNNRGPDEALLKIGEYFIKFQAGLTPPVVFVLGSFSIEDNMMREPKVYWELVGMSVVGMFLWTGACAVMWFAILVPRFKHIARRNELEYD